MYRVILYDTKEYLGANPFRCAKTPPNRFRVNGTGLIEILTTIPIEMDGGPYYMIEILIEEKEWVKQKKKMVEVTRISLLLRSRFGKDLLDFRLKLLTEELCKLKISVF
jgi:hypothetical protein